jgi:hypothetical protein
MHGIYSLLAACYRANPNLRLVLADHLSLEHQALYAGLRRDPDFYGLLLPADDSARTAKSVCRETALLFFTLQRPGVIPRYVIDQYGTETRVLLERLVLDDILQIHTEDGFRGGPAAAAAVRRLAPSPHEDAVQPTPRESAIARLSMEALRYAQRLSIAEPVRLSARLYFFNRIPISPEAQRRFPDWEAAASLLGLDATTIASGRLGTEWLRVSDCPPAEGWHRWRRHHLSHPSAGRQTYKLYISTAPQALRDALPTAIRVLEEFAVLQFKVGCDVLGVMRPDKLVAYFSTRDEMITCAGSMERSLCGLPAHGVPFTASLDDSGLLSWGTDPPSTEHLLHWQEKESWRLWVTNRLATSILAARDARVQDSEPWQFALERLRLDGVDTAAWTPTSMPWLAAPDDRSQVAPDARHH